MLCEDKLPEFTGDKLTAWGDVDSNFPGGIGLESPGEVSNYAGEVIPLNVDIPPGNNL